MGEEKEGRMIISGSSKRGKVSPYYHKGDKALGDGRQIAFSIAIEAVKRLYLLAWSCLI